MPWKQHSLALHGHGVGFDAAKSLMRISGSFGSQSRALPVVVPESAGVDVLESFVPESFAPASVDEDCDGGFDGGGTFFPSDSAGAVVEVSFVSASSLPGSDVAQAPIATIRAVRDIIVTLFRTAVRRMGSLTLATAGVRAGPCRS